MNDSILGIVITFIVLGLVLSIGVGAQGGVEFPSTGEYKIPQINAGTNTNTNQDGFYDYCYRMGLDC
tara:strand:+ start:1503 stop:1703 length:201 start_codon:yes stop_codon:yes gene_type:complete